MVYGLYPFLISILLKIPYNEYPKPVKSPNIKPLRLKLPVFPIIPETRATPIKAKRQHITFVGVSFSFKKIREIIITKIGAVYIKTAATDKLSSAIVL